MFFDVGFERDEILVNEIRDFPVRVRLSFQLSTCASGRGSGEIDQQRFVFGFRLRERLVGIT
ncbi:MAG: hypothetical protein DMF72_07295 [Acidobacteria bacterium]|nr:MAG: hypothetical protein DMF72_07295 [Acidobacteriota bacterium]